MNHDTIAPLGAGGGSPCAEIMHRAGEPFGPYRLEAPLGSGQYGVVWRATDTRNGKVVALKMIRFRSAEEAVLLKQEFRRMSDVSHPNLVFPLELQSHGDEIGLVMEYVQGHHLLDHPGFAGPDRERHIDRALSQLAAALEALHSRALVHRDVKPANILVTDGGHLLLLDYGFVQSMHANDGLITGTLAYCSPEVARGEPTGGPADWYAVGTMLYQILTGALPFPAEPAANLAAKIAQERPAPLQSPGIPVALARIVADLLEPDPTLRAGAVEVRRYLGALAPDDGSGLRAVPRPAVIGREAELGRLAAILASSASGQPTVVHVQGAAGMGKSTLLTAWHDQLAARADVWHLASRCYERDATPYQALDDLLGKVTADLAQLAKARLPALEAGQIEALARGFPGLALVFGVTPKPSLDPAGARPLAFAAVAHLMSALAGERRIVLTIDDLQWGDTESAELLDVLVDRITSPLVLVMSYRADERTNSPFLEAFLRREHPRARVIELPVAALASADATRLVMAVAPTLPPPELAPIIAEAEGCPFLLEMLALLRSSGERGPSLHDHLQALPSLRSSLESEVLQLVGVAGRPLAFAVLAAALSAERLVKVVTQLRGERLLRTSGNGTSMWVDVYHGRVRTALVGGLDAASQAVLNRRLADALLTGGSFDPELVARHLLVSDQPQRGIEHARTAAERAFELLAFERAAELLQLALAASPPADPACAAMRLRAAQAYSNAGHGRQAADGFIACAAQMPALRSELLRQASDQLFVSGHIAAAIDIARGLLRESGLAWPESLTRAKWMQLRCFMQILLARTRTTPWSGPPPAAELRFRIELCASLGRGLSSYDAVRGPAYLLFAARLALRHGYDGFAALGMGYTGFVLGLSGRPAAVRRADRWISAARALADARGDGLGRNFTTMVRGVLAVCHLDWKLALATLDPCIIALEQECVGAHWEAGIAKTSALLALFYRGDMNLLGARVPAYADEGRRRGDIALEIEASLYFGAIHVAADDPARAVAVVRRAIAGWQSDAFQYQHWIALRFEAYAALYAGTIDDDLRARFAHGVKEAKRAGQLAMQVMRVEVAHLSACLALASEGGRPPSRRTKASVARALRVLANEAPVAKGLAALLEAALARHGPDGAAELAALEQARGIFGECDMRAHVAAVNWRIAARSCDAPSRHEAEAALARLGIAVPARYAAMLVPG